MKLTILSLVVISIMATIGSAQSTGNLVAASAPVNYAPVADPQAIAISALQPVMLVLKGYDANGDNLTFSIVTGPSHGVLSQFNPTSGTVVYNPPTQVFATDSFRFAVSDGITTSAAATATITLLETTTVTLASSKNPSIYGTGVTLAATVTAKVGTPVGSVAFNDGAVTLGTSVLSGGRATIITSALGGGKHSITAVYAGAPGFNAGSSAILTQTVAKAATSARLSSSLNPSHNGNTVTFTATVISSTAGTPTGSVAFKDRATSLGTGMLSSGKATLTTAALAPGTHSVTAIYDGDSNFDESTSPALKQKVLP